jgi:hypothetical protein
VLIEPFDRASVDLGFREQLVELAARQRLCAVERLGFFRLLANALDRTRQAFSQTKSRRGAICPARQQIELG